ncbi:MAG: helix-turn-helix domain-containing protein [Thermoleophilia bacterium]
MEKLLDIRHVARLLGLSERTTYQMARDGRLPASRVGGRWRFRPEEIERWLAAATVSGQRAAGAHSPLGPERRDFEDALGCIEDPLERRLAFVAHLSAASMARGWLPPVVVGGHAVEFYTGGGYATVDIDLVSAHEPLEEVLPLWGFVSRGRHWLHEGLGLVVEAPGTHLGPGQRDRVTRVEIAGGTALVLGVEDVIIDRLAACVHWRSEEDCRWAGVLLSLFAARLDVGYLVERARAEEVGERLTVLLRKPELSSDAS